ncbi:MAG: autotransporter assembly complex family protein [Desulfobulbaceae bacterium]|nr:autotransporter assembly complex family protein [Desulfobulbaceae bacterium]
MDAIKYGMHFFLRKTAPALLIILFCCPSAFGREAPQIDISVTGLEGELRQNVLAHLSIVRQKDNPRLTDFLVRRLAGNIESEVSTALEPFGYYQPETDVDLAREENIWKIKIDVRTGKPVIITGIDVRLTGPGSGDKELLEAAGKFPLRRDDVLRHQLYENGKSSLLSQANASGYMDAKFSERSIIVNREQRTAEIFLTLDTGQQHLFGRTTFEADFLSHELLTKMLPYKEGDPFSSRALVRLRQSFYNADYFSNVEVAAGGVQKDTSSIPVHVTLTPKKPNKYGFGAGYGTDTGLRGTVEWTNRRLNHYGHQFTITLQPSERKSYYGGVYTIPLKDPRTDRLSLLAMWQKETFENTDTEQRTVSVSYDHVRERGEYSIYFKFLDEDFESGLETGHATLFIPGIKSTLRFADDPLVTERGVRATFELGGAHQDLLSDESFLQASLAAKGIYTFLESWRVIGRFQIGGTMVDTVNDLPPSLRFYAGGDQSVRGYAYKSIGPKDAFDNVLGGRYLLTSSVELEKRLTDSWSAAVFFDSGDAPNNFSDLAMKNGGGAGIRWNAPFGQVRLDVAKPLNDGDGSWRIHFNVGADL